MADTQRMLVPAATLLFFVGGLVFPAVRQRIRTGASGILLARSKDRLQRIVAAAVCVLFVFVGAFSVLYAWRGPGALGVRTPTRAAFDFGVVLGLVAFAVLVVSQAQMGRSWRVGIDSNRTELVTRGLYSQVRNPIYTSMLAMIAALVLVAPSWWTAGWALATALVLAAQARLEERHLLATHGDAYWTYARRTGRFLPGIGHLE